MAGARSANWHTRPSDHRDRLPPKPAPLLIPAPHRPHARHLRDAAGVAGAQLGDHADRDPRRRRTAARPPRAEPPTSTSPGRCRGGGGSERIAARWSSSARLRGLVRQPCADHSRCSVSTKSRPLRWRRNSSLAWPAHSHTETPRPRCTRTVRPRLRSTQIAQTSCFAGGTSRLVRASPTPHQHAADHRRRAVTTRAKPRVVSRIGPPGKGRILDANAASEATSAKWPTLDRPNGHPQPEQGSTPARASGT